MKFSLKLSFLAFSLFALIGCQNNNDYAAYETWDADGNELVDGNEFNTTFADAGYYSAWDTDADGIIDETEWDAGVATYYPVYNGDDYTRWDLDGNEALDEDEFTVGTYPLWDTNGDGNIEVVEYEEWNHDL